MLEVCAAIAQSDDRVNLKSLIDRSGVSEPSLYLKPLRRLRALELLKDAPRPGDDRRERWYVKSPSSLWAAARELAE